MEHVTPQAFTAFATIGAAFIGGLVAFLVSVLSKEQKTSEFRQQWVDALRNDIAELIGEAALLHDTNDRMAGRDLKTTEAQIEARYSNMVNVRTLIARIELRANPDEHTAFLTALHHIQLPDFQRDVSIRDAKLDALTSAAQAMLKKEWQRVKTGERTFFVTKYIAGAIATTALIVAAWAVYLNLPTAAASPVIVKPATP